MSENNTTVADPAEKASIPWSRQVFNIYIISVSSITFLLLAQFAYLIQRNKASVSRQLKVHIFMLILGMVSTLLYYVPMFVGAVNEGWLFKA